MHPDCPPPCLADARIEYPERTAHISARTGAELRDDFAKAALAACEVFTPKGAADWAYQVADAMLARRLR